MDMISIIASILLVLGCLYIVFSPFIGKSKRIDAAIAFSTVATEEPITKQELYATLNEIEMDYKMHKLSKEDYYKMKKAYEQMVADIMKNESANDRKKSVKKESDAYISQIEAEIDAELAALRKERGQNS